MAGINISKLEELMHKESALRAMKDYLKAKENYPQYMGEFKSSADVKINPKQLREEKLDCLLGIYDKNQFLWKEIVIKGNSPGDGLGSIGKEKKITNAHYYPYKGIFVTSKSGGSRGSWHPNIPHSGSDTYWYDYVYYIPKEKKFISVGITNVNGHTAGYCGRSYSHKTYNGFKEITKSEVLKSVDFRKIISSLKYPIKQEKSIKHIRIKPLI